jgi:acetolactate synthase-like protein
VCVRALVLTRDIRVQQLNIPVYLGGMARGLLGRAHRLQMRQQRRDALRECDVLVLAGAVADFRLSYGRVFSRHTRIITVNRDRTQLTKVWLG